ncbi:Gfo/Idh/MocA family protein [Actinoplanes derwentensis]|uniref:Predicted dehydrogenase n=1 Tax=Actinoplanes derwentensis TaxID=113562 RepID=A0A1H1V7N6_9ACTN|nr:Gfo/Idh/MocA family oxidoreductase [Actinoplanes derwentensis]GID89255.1 oxidoreductase [Actinoplanes derwentensis]SDS80725.1 Predicted dehydrogenase [Actinoplanes derwentensis]
MTAGKPTLGVGVVGFGWMGQVHARAFSRLLQHYPDAPLRPRFVAVADTATDDRSQRAAAAFGFEHQLTDWRDLIARDDVDVVCVTGPNFIHRDVAVAAAQAGKHLWVEKPAGRTSAETGEIVAAVQAAGVQAAAGFNYRNAPAVEYARHLVRSGRLGRIEHTAVRFCSDYSAHPDGALTWRFQNEFAGSGVLGDLVSHAVDLVRFVVGDLTELVVDRATFITERPAALGAASHFSRGADGPRLPVENEDYVAALLRLADGSRGTLESSRTEVGDQNAYSIEVHGTEGALAWNYRRMGELRVCLDQDVQDAQYATLMVTPAHGELGAFQPGSANPMSYDDLKVVEAYRLVESIGTGKPVGATVTDALIAARTIDAMLLSSQERRWVTLGEA